MVGRVSQNRDFFGVALFYFMCKCYSKSSANLPESQKSSAKISALFFYLSSSSQITQKLCESLEHFTCQMTALVLEMLLSGLELHASYDW